MIIKKNNLTRVASALTSLVLLTTPVAQAASYTDVPAGEWYYDYVMEASNKGVVNGYEDSTFRPDNVVALGECIKMILGYKSISCELGSNHWADNYVSKALELGIISEGEYSDNELLLSRQQVAKMIILALGEEDADTSNLTIPDLALISEAYQPYVKQAYIKGIITGYEDGSFIGDKAISRAELLTVLERAFDASKRQAYSPSALDHRIAYVRQDIDIRVNGIHCAPYKAGVGGQVIQCEDKIYIPSTAYFKTERDRSFETHRTLGYSPVTGITINEEYTLRNVEYHYEGESLLYKKDFRFQNKWQVANNVYKLDHIYLEGEKYTQPVEGYKCTADADLVYDGDVYGARDYFSISTLQSHGIPVEYDPVARVVYIGDKEPVFYGHVEPESDYWTGYIPGPIALRDYPIVSIVDDIYNCHAGLGVDNHETAHQYSDGSIDFDTRNNDFLNVDSSYRSFVLNVKGAKILAFDPHKIQGRAYMLDLLTGNYIYTTDSYANATIYEGNEVNGIIELDVTKHPYLLIVEDGNELHGNSRDSTNFFKIEYFR